MEKHLAKAIEDQTWAEDIVVATYVRADKASQDLLDLQKQWIISEKI